MASRFVEMWRWQGKIDRKSYAIAGCSAFVLKYFLDKMVAAVVFERTWFLWSYWQPLGPDTRISGHAVDFGAAVHLAGRDADGPAFARCRTTPVAGSAFFCSRGQPPVLLLALRDGIALGDGGARSNAVAGNQHARSLDSAECDRSGSDGDRSHHCDWFLVYGTGDGGASVLWVGIVRGIAVLPGAVLG